MSQHGTNKTFLDYRNGLRKVGFGQSRKSSQSTTLSASPHPSPPTTPLKTPDRPSSKAAVPTSVPADAPPPSNAAADESRSSEAFETATVASSKGSVYSTQIPSTPTMGSTQPTTENESSSQTPTKASPSPTISTAVPTQSLGPVPSKATTSRTAVVILGASAPSNLAQYLHTAISSHEAGEVLLLGSNQMVLKEAKMSCYTVAGKLGRNVSAQTVMLDDKASVLELAKAVNEYPSKVICGVLYCQSPQLSFTETGEPDILSLEEEDLETSIRSSVLTIHSIARQTIPLMPRLDGGINGLSITLESQQSATPRPYFVIDTDTDSRGLPSVVKIAQASLLHAIARSSSAKGVDVGHAKDFLLPPPPPPRPATPREDRTPQQLPAISIPQGTNGYSQPSELTPEAGESPTKLWNLWSMQNE